MCELTVPGTTRGAAKHYYRDEPACDECRSAAAEYKRSIWCPERSRWQMTWKMYRLRKQDYDAILARQGGVCAMCQGTLRTISTHIDHDHACDHPGRGRRSCARCVRGILCRRCNLGIAILDDREWLSRAVRYLGNEHVAEILRENRLF